MWSQKKENGAIGVEKDVFEMMERRELTGRVMDRRVLGTEKMIIEQRRGRRGE